MATLLKDEYCMVSFKTYKENKLTTLLTILLNVILLRGIGGSGTKEFLLTLTNNNLYVEGIGYNMMGQLEVFYTDKIDRSHIKAFEVRKEESKEIITLLKSNGKKIIYVRNNEDSLNLAEEMANLINTSSGN